MGDQANFGSQVEFDDPSVEKSSGGTSKKNESDRDWGRCKIKHPNTWGLILGWVISIYGISTFGAIFQPKVMQNMDTGEQGAFAVCSGQPFFALFVGLIGLAMQLVPLAKHCEKTECIYERGSKYVNLWSKGIVWLILGTIGVLIAISAYYPPFVNHQLCFPDTNRNNWCYDAPTETFQEMLKTFDQQQQPEDVCKGYLAAGTCTPEAQGINCLKECYPDMLSCPSVKASGFCSAFMEQCKATCQPCAPNNVYCCNTGPWVFFGFAVTTGIALIVFYIVLRRMEGS